MLSDSTAPMMLLNLMDEKEYKQNNIAKPTGINIATISNFLNGVRTIKFGDAFCINKLFFKDSKSKFLRSVIKTYEGKKDIAPSLEYLSVNYFLDDLEELLNRIYCYKGLEELYTTYSLLLRYQRGNFNKEDMLSEINTLYKKVKSDELLIILQITEANIYGINREYKSLFRVAESVEKKIFKMKETFIKSSTEIRLHEILAQAYLFHKSNTEESRFYAKRIISSKISAKFSAYASYIIGTSYMFRDYLQAYYNLKESFDQYEELGFKHHSKEVLKSIHLLQTYWGIGMESSEEDMDESEVAHRYAKRGEKDKSLEILNRIPETVFRIYYRALATNDYNLHFKALGGFIKEGDMFYANLPLKELQKDETFKNIANNIYNN